MKQKKSVNNVDDPAIADQADDSESDSEYDEDGNKIDCELY